jgi:hypothetical protein
MNLLASTLHNLSDADFTTPGRRSTEARSLADAGSTLRPDPALPCLQQQVPEQRWVSDW